MLAARRMMIASAGAPPTFRSASGAYSTFAGTGDAIVSKPAGLTAGDLMIAVVEPYGGGSFTSIVPPSGWTLQASDNGGAGFQVGVYTRFAGSSEPSSYTWTRTGGGNLQVGIVAYSGATAVDEVQVHAATAGAGAAFYLTPTLSASPTLLIYAGSTTTGFTSTGGGPQRLLVDNTTDAIQLSINDVSGSDHGSYQQAASSYFGAVSVGIH